jgi:exopolyphosphatase/guanosine-5'-triphosphate,3'-diphosphate pyrophosphatase
VTRVAALDCGTHSIRLLVANVVDGRLDEVTREMRIVRLGQGVDTTGRLHPEALDRARVALTEYAEELRRLGVDQTRAVATSALRDASNAAAFVEVMAETVGVTPEVISGEEEARLSFTGAVRELVRGPAEAVAAPPFLVVDIGGGSTELVLGDEAAVKAARSVDVGCVRITERHFADDPPTPSQIRAAEDDIVAAVAEARATVPVEEAETLVGLAGSVTTVTALALGLPAYQRDAIHHARVSRAQVAEVSQWLLRATKAEREAVPVIHSGRVPVIAAGALVLRIIMEQVGAESVLASEHDILDGIAWSVVGSGAI